MIRGTDFILNPDKLEEQFQLVEVSEWIDYNTKEKLGFYYTVLFPKLKFEKIVYNCWINVPSMIGKKKINSCFQITPSVIAFFSIVFFPIFLSLSCIFHIFCFFSM